MEHLHRVAPSYRRVRPLAVPAPLLL
uniref:Uncharacterized protein n=1 Tax=Rhizophora mucronata TaxID=61149 RepID=A0A2P2R2R2_RHIMU